MLSTSMPGAPRGLRDTAASLGKQCEQVTVGLFGVRHAPFGEPGGVGEAFDGPLDLVVEGPLGGRDEVRGLPAAPGAPQ